MVKIYSSDFSVSISVGGPAASVCSLHGSTLMSHYFLISSRLQLITAHIYVLGTFAKVFFSEEIKLNKYRMLLEKKTSIVQNLLYLII